MRTSANCIAKKAALSKRFRCTTDRSNLIREMPLQINTYAENLVKRGEPERATQYYERSIERKPRSIGALAGAGRLLMKLERFEEALEHFRELATILPDRAGPQRRMCACLRELGRPEDAAEACKRADELKR